jgi:Domain of unknown function (DUF3291)
MPLAQLNIARMRFALDSPEMASFVAQLAEVNEAAEAADGFVWRLKDADGPGSTGYRILDDDGLIVNLSVWRDLDALRAFVVGFAQHRDALRGRSAWFERADEPMTACWQVDEGHEPSVQEAEDMLLLLRREGPSDRVFPFTHRG